MSLFKYYLVGRDSKRNLRVIACDNEYIQKLNDDSKAVKKEVEQVINKNVTSPILLLIVNKTPTKPSGKSPKLIA